MIVGDDDFVSAIERIERDAEESRKDDSKEKTLSTKATLPFRGSSEHNILNNTPDYDSYNDQLGGEIDDFDKDFVVVFNENLGKGRATGA